MEFEAKTVQFDAQGRVLIPKSLREAIGASKGDEFIAQVDEGRLVLESRSAVLKRLQAKYRGLEVSLADELIKERREEAAREGG